MRKIIVQEMISFDGFFAGPHGEIDWHNVDEEFNDFAVAALETYDTLLFGRVTYDLMAGYWPTPASSEDSPLVAAKMNALTKIVVSKKMKKAEWQNSQVMPSLDAAEIRKMKSAAGKDIAIFGSGTIVAQLTERGGLIDEYRFIVNPVILGTGKSLFTGVTSAKKLKFLNTHQFRSGNVLVAYAPA